MSKVVLKYLQFLTKSYIKRQNIEIIGLTGSAGKTTLTVAIHAILSKKYRTGVTYKSGHGLNSESGIPFAILGVHVDGYSIFDWIKYLTQSTINFFIKRCPYEKYIVEMGVDKPGDMDHLLGMLQPVTGIFLSIAKVHGANFEILMRERKGIDILDLIFEEKAKLIWSLPEKGNAILNNDSKRIRGLGREITAKVFTFGLGKNSDLVGKILESSSKQFKGKVIHKDKSGLIQISKYVINKRVFQTLLAAVSVGVIYDIPLIDCAEAISSMDFPPGRVSKFTGVKDTIILDSSYNSSKPALLEALDNLFLYKERKRIAVLGDMRELGTESESEHRGIAKRVIEVAEELVIIGPAMKEYFYPEAIRLGFDKSKIYTFNNTWEALDFVKSTLIKGREVILVKGSQNTLFLEIIVEGLLRKKSDEKLLCRRGAFWEKKRQAFK